MNLSIFYFFALIGLTVADLSYLPSRGCIYALGKCVRQCENGTHGYSSGCVGPLHPEPTCEQPNPPPIPNGAICDYSACHCDFPTVRDKASGRCVYFDQCPIQKAKDCAKDIFGRCLDQCEVGSHSYRSGCVGPLSLEPTCEDPNPQPIANAATCDHVACHCNFPTVRDRTTGQCVSLDQCPKKKFRGCANFILGKCVGECEVGTHSYTADCLGPFSPEPTCDEPSPQPIQNGGYCDYSTCRCDFPTVRDKVSGKCVSLDRCPNKNSRGCATYILGKCVVQCENGTHSYGTGCVGPLIPEATCDEPNPQPIPNGAKCDYSTCYCDFPTVRDKTSGKCVPYEQCPIRNGKFCARYVAGKCLEQCEVGTTSYASGCVGPLLLEPTCENPNPQPIPNAATCDHAACHCNFPTVRDKTTGKCVSLDRCPKNKFRGCANFILGKCVGECEVGTHSYTAECLGPFSPEPTCDEPSPQPIQNGGYCDYSTCRCDFPTVRDKVSGKCVSLDRCPNKNSRGCATYILGKCVGQCEIGTHSYGTGCVGPLIPEPTCDEPNPQPIPNGAKCDYSTCYCDFPTVRDKTSGKCVPFEQCPIRNGKFCARFVAGKCLEQCEVGTTSYASGCVGPLLLEPTCENPNPQPIPNAATCDHAACHCNFPTVRDKTTGKCVSLDRCPKNKFRGCANFILGKCVGECEVGTHSYTADCLGPFSPEPTCDEPSPQPIQNGGYCDYSTCRCDFPTVRDKVSGKCVSLDRCPNKNSRGCATYILGKCVGQCEIGTHSYGTGCVGPLIPEPTCDEPNPQPIPNGAKCDYSTCYCDFPTVRDKTSGKCVPFEQCPIRNGKFCARFVAGKCLEQCEAGTYSYTSGCVGPLFLEPTCEDPNPQPIPNAATCDHAACHCNFPTVRNKITGKCVPLDRCPPTRESTGCIYALGKCIRRCENGTHSYGTGCVGPFTPEATCDEPHPLTIPNGAICDYSACHCDFPTVRDKASGKCVFIDQCDIRKPKISTGCALYIGGRCIRQCQQGSHSYASGSVGDMVREPTCEDPNPQPIPNGAICDHSACHCDFPTVRDSASGKCIPLSQCRKPAPSNELNPWFRWPTDWQQNWPSYWDWLNGNGQTVLY